MKILNEENDFNEVNKKEELKIPLLIERKIDHEILTDLKTFKDEEPLEDKPEVTYVDDDEIFEDNPIGLNKRPKWQTPTTKFQERLLDSVGRKYYQSRNERSAVIEIEKSALALSDGLVSIYPIEWVETCIEWAIKKRKDGFPVMLLGLLNLINDSERRTDFIARWRLKHLPGRTSE